MEKARKFDESHDSFNTESTSEVESQDNKNELNSTTFCKDKSLSDHEEETSLMECSEDIPLTHPILHNQMEKTVEAEMELNSEVKGEASGCELQEESDETNGTPGPLTPSSKTSLKSHILGVLRCTCGHRHEPVSNEMDYVQPTSIRPARTSHILRVLRRISLFAVGLAALVVGGVSSNFHPHVDPGEYENCTVTGQLMMNDTNDW